MARKKAQEHFRVMSIFDEVRWKIGRKDQLIFMLGDYTHERKDARVRRKSFQKRFLREFSRTRCKNVILTAY